MIAESQALIKQLKDENEVLSLQKQVVESKLETANLKITVLTEKLQRAEAALTGQGNHQTPATFSTTTDTGSSPERFKRVLSDLEQGEASLMEPSSKRPRLEKY
ncbi:hypothetical protein [Estrella lausannensis]|uniref:hypothetical protein n=1 Tax=Estrella lausannensis TaxID=483423 RepID=UPI000BF04302|nr:hypothetical protein [Estrella lausannensis]